MITAKILADSLAANGSRLTTFELSYPRFIHAQLLTHRLFSRNSASSRAIPTRTLLSRIEDDPVMPVHWGKNQRGMQAFEELSGITRTAAEDEWLRAADNAVESARKLLALGVHKQIANRIVEPWMVITTILSATEWDNWYHLRGADAQPEIARLATLMAQCQNESEPVKKGPGEWHLPLVETEDGSDPLYVDPTEAPGDDLLKISTARCARVSYLTHDGERDLAADIALHDRLRDSGHWSPFEHVAVPKWRAHRCGNFMGWMQYRKTFSAEHHGRQLERLL